MNKKDCGLIGYILSHAYEYGSIQELIERLIKIDPRIEEEFISFSENRLRNKEIDALRDKKLEEKFGSLYCLKKACTVAEYKKARDEAEKELQGEKV